MSERQQSSDQTNLLVCILFFFLTIGIYTPPPGWMDCFHMFGRADEILVFIDFLRVRKTWS